ncbi:MAG: hypothetical protein VX820_00735 [Candidatus Neomarinimicrobiota bacterium]|nr:hypothetical protein [Candidatus Neomarinimicrobiota bacterium]|tara:strand:- start:139 stop:1275 length:1137 start_codon:yes stop_codon:yes gene_type:complete
MKEQKIIKLSFIIILSTIIDITFALPRFSISNATSCIACHVNPTGAGMRNSYGNDIVSLEELPLKKWIQKGEENWDGYITDEIQLGGDIRLQGIQFNDTDSTQTSAFFPMQTDIYLNMNLNENSSLFTKLGIQGKNNLNMEYWVLIKDLPFNSWVKIGRTMPNYGMKIDDHTSFTRGGNFNRSKIGLNKENPSEPEGLIFGPYLASPILIEHGISITKKMELTYSISTSIINNLSEKMDNFSAKFIFYGNSFNTLNSRMSFNYMNERNFMMFGLSGGLSINRHTFSFAIDQANNWIDNATSIALFNEYSWEYTQGIHFIAKYDFFDPRLNIKNGSINRYSLGIEIYPINIMEIKLQTRISEAIDKQKPEFLIQTHFYF